MILVLHIIVNYYLGFSSELALKSTDAFNQIWWKMIPNPLTIIIMSKTTWSRAALWTWTYIAGVYFAAVIYQWSRKMSRTNPFVICGGWLWLTWLTSWLFWPNWAHPTMKNDIKETKASWRSCQLCRCCDFFLNKY